MLVDQLDQLLKAGAYLKVRREVDRALEAGGVSCQEEGAVLGLACRACLYLADYYAAAKLGERAVKRADAAADVHTLGRAHFDLGVAYTHIGDTYGAEEHLESFLSLLPQVKELETWEGKAYFNLSFLQRQRRQWQAAIQLLERAAAIFARTVGQRPEQIRCALDIAWCYMRLGEPALAGPHLALAEEYLGGFPDAGLTNELLCHKAYYYHLEGDVATSNELCTHIFMPGRHGVTSHHTAGAAWVMGENAMGLGRLEEANLCVNMALDHAAHDNWPTLMNLAADLRRRIAAKGLDTTSN